MTRKELVYNSGMYLMLALLLLSQSPGIDSQPVTHQGRPLLLTQHLELTEEQLFAVSSLNQQTASYQSRQTEKELELQVLIAQETAKESPDPFVIGTHYVELEKIKRNLAAEKRKVTSRIQELLTDIQKAKLAELEKVLLWQSVACQAVSANFIQEPVGIPFRGIPGFPVSIVPVPPAGGSREGHLISRAVFGPVDTSLCVASNRLQFGFGGQIVNPPSITLPATPE